MSVEEFYAWGDEHCYPKLVLGGNDVLESGFTSWYKLLFDTDERIARAIARIEVWQARLERERKEA